MIHREPRRAFQSAFYGLCRELAGACMIGLTGVRHFNVPDLAPLGGLLIAPNHQSYLDPVLVGMAFHRPIHYLARDSLFRTPGFGHLLRAVNSHPVKRGRLDIAAVRTVVNILRSGEPLLMFAEGTRSPDGRLGRFHPGVGNIAARCGVPVLPVCIEGAFECWPRTKRLPVPARVAVAFGGLLWPQGMDGQSLTPALVESIRGMRRSLRCYLGRWE